MGRPDNNSKILALTQGYATNARESDNDCCIDTDHDVKGEVGAVVHYEIATGETPTIPKPLPHNLALLHAIRTYERYGAGSRRNN